MKKRFNIDCSYRRIVDDDTAACSHPRVRAPGFVVSPAMCKMCVSRLIDDDPAELPSDEVLRQYAIAQRRGQIDNASPVCAHRGEQVAEVTCTLCGRRGQREPVHTCTLYHCDCTFNKYQTRAQPERVCLSCKDFVPLETVRV